MTRPLAALLTLLAAAPARPDPAPAPPPDHPPRVVEAGSVVWVRPSDDDGGPPAALSVGDGGGVYLDPPAYAYQVELRRWQETQHRACLQLLDEKPPPKLVWLATALLAGAAVGYAAARYVR